MTGQRIDEGRRMRWKDTLLPVIVCCIIAVLSVRRNFLGQILCVPLGVFIALYCIRRTRWTGLVVEIITIAWVITAFSPVDLAIRNGPEASVRFAEVVTHQSPVRLSRENPGRAFVFYYERHYPFEPRWAVVIVIPTEREIVTPLFSLRGIAFLGPRQDPKEGLGDW